MRIEAVVKRLKWLVWAAHFGLASGLYALIAGSGRESALVLATLAILPLLLPVPGLLRGRAYTASWTSMLVAFYCALLLSEAYMQPAYKLPLLLLAVVAAADFVALMLFAKGAKALARNLG